MLHSGGTLETRPISCHVMLRGTDYQGPISHPILLTLQTGRCSWPHGKTFPTRMKPSSRSETVHSTQVSPAPSVPLILSLYPPNVGLPWLSDPAEAASNKLQSSNIFTVAKRSVEGQDMLYQSLKLTNGIWVLAELRIQPGNPSLTVRTPVPTQVLTLYLPALAALPQSAFLVWAVKKW